MTEPVISDLAKSELSHRGFRMFKDKVFGATMAVGGVTVILAILTIFVYLLYVVLPLFRSAQVSPVRSVPLSVGQVAQFTLNEYAEIGFVLLTDGAYRFVEIATGQGLAQGSLIPAQARMTALNGSTRGPRTVAIALASGEVLLAKPRYQEHFEENRRISTPEISYPLGPAPVRAVPTGRTISALAAEANDEGATIAAVASDKRLYLTNYAKVDSLIEDEASFEATQVEVAAITEDVAFITLDVDQQELYVVSASGHVRFFDIRYKEAPRLVQELQVVPSDTTVTAVEFLSGGTSLLIGDSQGHVTQWFPVRDNENNYRLTHVRTFSGFEEPKG